MESLDSLLKTLRAAQTEADLRTQFHDALTAIGVTVYNYGAGTIHAADGATLDRIWSNMPQSWIARYIERNYQRWDRLVRESFRRTTPFTYAQVFSTEPETAEQAEMETQFPYRNGVVVPIHSPMHRFGILSAVVDQPILGVDDGSSDFVARVALLAATAHETAERLSVLGGKSGLTEREKECLLWVARGKTNDETAQILGITERTVRKHIGQAREKLSVSNRAQAVALALAKGLIEV